MGYSKSLQSFQSELKKCNCGYYISNFIKIKLFGWDRAPNITNRNIKGTLPSEPVSVDEYKILCTMVNFHFDALLSALGGGSKFITFI